MSDMRQSLFAATHQDGPYIRQPPPSCTSMPRHCTHFFNREGGALSPASELFRCNVQLVGVLAALTWQRQQQAGHVGCLHTYERGDLRTVKKGHAVNVCGLQSCVVG
jgi:hypothetical protein